MKRPHSDDRKRMEKRKRENSNPDTNTSKRARTDQVSSKQPRNQKGSPSNRNNDRNSQRGGDLWHGQDEDISETRETPEEETARKRRQGCEGLKKLESRVCRSTGHENAQNTSGTDKPPQKISPFRAINEENGEMRAERPEGDISPLYKDTHPELYASPGTPPKVDEQHERSGEDNSENEIEDDQTGKRVVDTSEILSEPETDHEGSEQEDQEDQRHQEPPIKTEPEYYLEEGPYYKETEEEYEQEPEQESESDDEPPTKRRVVLRRDKPTRNQRRSIRKKINHKQKSNRALDRIDLTKSANYRSRTPSSESRSEENTRPRASRRQHSPEGDEYEDDDERHTNRDRRAHKKDNKMPKNRNSRRQ